jgi:hypothetical protein
MIRLQKCIDRNVEYVEYVEYIEYIEYIEWCFNWNVQFHF